MNGLKDFIWAEGLSCGVTVCDLDANILYQNAKARKIFSSYGDLTGKNIKNCHTGRSWEIITSMIQNGTSNSYTIEKNGVKKLIHQTPWYSEGKIAGLVEFSIELPQDLPHYVRD